LPIHLCVGFGLRVRFPAVKKKLRRVKYGTKREFLGSCEKPEIN